MSATELTITAEDVYIVDRTSASPDGVVAVSLSLEVTEADADRLETLLAMGPDGNGRRVGLTLTVDP